MILIKNNDNDNYNEQTIQSEWIKLDKDFVYEFMAIRLKLTSSETSLYLSQFKT